MPFWHDALHMNLFGFSEQIFLLSLIQFLLRNQPFKGKAITMALKSINCLIADELQKLIGMTSFYCYK
jgi:hypothetical protein